MLLRCANTIRADGKNTYFHFSIFNSKEVINLSIFRVEKNGNYTVMNRTALNDKRLSWKAKGIIAYMLSMPDDWVFYIEELVTHSTDGEKAFRSGLKELKDNGYVKRYPVYEDKKIKHWETVIHEVPQTDLDAQKVHVGFVHVGKLQVGNEGLLSTDSKLSTDDTKYSPEFEEFWSVYPRKIEKKEAYKKFKKAIKKYSIDIIVNGTEKYAQSVQNKEKDFIKHPATFLNKESFIDGYEEIRNQVESYQPLPQKESVISGFWGDEQ